MKELAFTVEIKKSMYDGCMIKTTQRTPFYPFNTLVVQQTGVVGWLESLSRMLKVACSNNVPFFMYLISVI